MRFPNPMRAGRGLLVLALALLGVAACAGPPAGPAFTRAAPPPEHRARLYLYRADVRSSPSTVRLSIDGRELGTLRNGEYETLELSAGSHQLRAGLRSLAFVAWGWNEQRLRLLPGETAFVKISVRLTEREIPAGGSVEIAGRQGGGASENVYLEPQGEEAALRALATTTRRVP